MHPVSATYQFGLLSFGLTSSSLSFCCSKPGCAHASAHSAHLCTAPRSCEVVTRAHGVEGQQAMGSQKAEQGCAVFWGQAARLPPLKLSLADYGEKSNSSPGVCAREGYRDPSAHVSAESLIRRLGKFSHSQFLFFLHNSNLIDI